MPKQKKKALIEEPKKANHSSAIVLTLILSLALGAAVFAQTEGRLGDAIPKLEPPVRTDPPVKLPVPTSKTIDGACVAAAIDARDGALNPVIATYQSTVLAAFKTRTNSLEAAWNGEATERKAAIKAANEAYTKTLREARKTMKTAKQTAMKTFTATVKKCAGGTRVSASDTGTISVESDL